MNTYGLHVHLPVVAFTQNNKNIPFARHTVYLSIIKTSGTCILTHTGSLLF